MRTILTLLSTIVAFLLFGILNGVDAYIKQTVDRAHLDILVINSSGGLPLPFAYLRRLQEVKGIKSLTYVSQLGGYYHVPTSRVSVLLTDPESFFRTDADMQASQSDQQAMTRTRMGALVTPGLARKYGWKRGDIISVHSVGTPQKNGSLDWPFQIVGAFNLPIAPDAPLIIANYSYGDLGRATNAGTVLQFMTLIENPEQAGTISAEIDNKFVNSPAQTRTLSQKDAAQSALARIGNIDFFLNAIIAAVFFTLLLLVGNALMQSYRERIREFGLLKTLGYSNATVASLVVAESLVLCVAAAAIGLSLAWIGLPLFGRLTGGSLPSPPGIVAISGLSAAMLVGVICGAVPAWRASRLTIVGALARH
jgi:putative ABC transport system permease protein